MSIYTYFYFYVYTYTTTFFTESEGPGSEQILKKKKLPTIGMKFLVSMIIHNCVFFKLIQDSMKYLYKPMIFFSICTIPFSPTVIEVFLNFFIYLYKMLIVPRKSNQTNSST